VAANHQPRDDGANGQRCAGKHHLDRLIEAGLDGGQKSAIASEASDLQSNHLFFD
jgi:hypothetical protein